MSLIFILPFVFLGIFVNARPVYPNSTLASTRYYTHVNRNTKPPLKVKKVKLGRGDNEKEYTMVPIPEVDQGAFSSTYEVLESIRGYAAIAKEVYGTDSVIRNKTDKEIDYLEHPVVDLFLFATQMPGADGIYIILKNVRKFNPAMRPFHEWYLEDESMLAEEGLAMLRSEIRRRLLGFYAKEHDILYYDAHLLNIFTAESLDMIIPVDWGPSAWIYPNDGSPPRDFVRGVEDVDSNDREAHLLYFEKELDRRLSKNFNVATLDILLRTRGKQLRAADLRIEIFSGKTFELVLAQKGKESSVYNIVGGYHDAKMAVMEIASKDLEEEILQDLKEIEAILLDSFEKEGNTYIVYTLASWDSPQT